MAVLEDGERLVGEWLMQAHGTRYDLLHEPFVAFDLMVEDRRHPFDVFLARVAKGKFIVPTLLHRGAAFSVESALRMIGRRGEYYGHHGALDPVEGAVWRVERDKLTDRFSGIRHRAVDFLVKFVRLDKIDGTYLPEITNGEPVWNWQPTTHW